MPRSVRSRLARTARTRPPAALASLNGVVSERLADLLDNDPQFRDAALEVGLIDQRWLEDPAARPLSRVPPAEVMRRFLERAAERRPSVVTRLGLTTVQALSSLTRSPKADEVPSTVTVVFTDLEGFTSYTARHGDDAALTLLAEHYRVVGPIVRRWGGRVVKRLGDGLMLVFDDPGYAVRAAVELVDARPDALPLRAGVHHGTVVVTKDDLFGHAVNVAARVTDLAKGGQVLVSSDVLDAAGEITSVALSKRARKRVKGVPESLLVYRAKAVGRRP
ncbi:MAG: adenylate/guanylate cyclase domain-containing protein [Actinophytocola sp.]|nr:adenylate/guanylate cyclase domain-containing protein [Actinophytocola sp.]